MAQCGTRTVTPSQTTKKQPIKRKRKNSDEKFDSMALMHDALRDMGVKKIKKVGFCGAFLDQ